jgi:hypothetical protein
VRVVPSTTSSEIISAKGKRNPSGTSNPQINLSALKRHYSGVATSTDKIHIYILCKFLPEI